MFRILIVLCISLGFGHLIVAQDEAQSPYETALARILEAEQEQATRLDLVGLGLRELPPRNRQPATFNVVEFG